MLNCAYCGLQVRRVDGNEMFAGVAAHGMQRVASTNTSAVLSLVAGVLGWTLMPLVATPVAIVLGHIARGQIRKTGEGGDGLALAGLIMGYLQVMAVLVAVFLILLLGGGLLAALAN